LFATWPEYTMGKLLYLVHRLPYPPNKGDKVRSYHLLKHLVAGHRVFLGTFVDDPLDEVFVDSLRAICPDLFVARLNPRSAKLRSLSSLLTHEPLSLRYYQDRGLKSWVDQTLLEHNIDATVIFSSVMAQYVQAPPGVARPPMLVDFVDVDSAKWTQYATQHPWPMSRLYQREGECLLAHERAVAVRAQHSFFVTENESALFLARAPECAGSVESMSNGVDADYFAPDPGRLSPFDGASGQAPLVFTGAMDYWPNIDAVTWFVQEILRPLRELWPKICFYIVGRNPPPNVVALAGEGVVVTGTVADVRPYLQHAAIVVAPLRIARGIQNKILEAMAMGRPVVAAQSCVDALAVVRGEELVSAAEPADFVRELHALLLSPDRGSAIGKAGRERVLCGYSWTAHLSKIDRHLPARDKA
jgi:sugar transferase (PEP-CTERM/EpsH1 system associated)